MVRSVFKTVEAFARGLVGSIPTLSRHLAENARRYWACISFDTSLVTNVSLRPHEGEISINEGATARHINRPKWDVGLRHLDGDVADDNFYQVLVENTPAFVFAVSVDGQLEFVNERASDFVVDGGALLGDAWRAFVHPDDLLALDAEDQEHRANGTPYVGEWRVVREDGTYRYVEVRLRAVRDNEHRIVRWFGSAVDIDAQRRAIAAFELLAASDAALATAQDVDTMLANVARASLPGLGDIAIFDVLEEDGRKKRTVAAGDSVSPDVVTAIEAYDAPQAGLGRFVSTAMAKRQSIHVPIVDVAAFFAPTEAPAHDPMLGIPVRSIVVAPVISHDRAFGTLTLLRTTTAVPFDTQDVRVVEEIARRTATAVELIRVTEFARAEVIKRDERFHQIADAIPQLMYTTDEEGAVDWVNAGWVEYSGLGVDATLGRGGLLRIVHVDDVEAVRKAWNVARDAEEPFQCEFRIRAADGTYRWFLGRATAVRTSAGTKWYGTNTDIDDARRADRTLHFFDHIGEALSESLELHATLDVVMRAIVPTYADWAFVALADDVNDLYVSSIYHDDSHKHAQLSQSVGSLFARASAVAASLESFRDRKALLHQNGSYSTSVGHVEIDALKMFGTVGGFGSVLELPLVAGADARGTLVIAMTDGGRTFAPSEIPFFTELARRIAPSIANAQIYERERRVAQSFQRAALPASLPAIDGFVFSAIYEAGRAEALVGGDWYDAFTLLDGRVVISIGDVQGSGLRAAVTMANIRQAIRGVAHIDADPTRMLEAADRALRNENPEAFATAFVGVIDPISNELTYKSAGHPAGLIRRPDSRVEELHSGGLPLGLRQTEHLPTDITSVDVGSVLYLYTDGLTESTRDILEGERCVRASIVAETDVPPGSRAQALYDGVLIDGSSDDVAILTVSIVARPEPSRWTVDATDVSGTREIRAKILAALDLSKKPHQFWIAEQIIAEVVGNLARHASDTVDIVLSKSEGRRVLHVLDRGEGFELVSLLPADIYAERGRGLFLIANLAADFNITRRPLGGYHMRIVFDT